MKLEVDQELCIGCGACEETCPQVFDILTGFSRVKLDPVPEELQSSALEAEEGCPVGAISHTE